MSVNVIKIILIVVLDIVAIIFNILGYLVFPLQMEIPEDQSPFKSLNLDEYEVIAEAPNYKLITIGDILFGIAQGLLLSMCWS